MRLDHVCRLGGVYTALSFLVELDVLICINYLLFWLWCLHFTSFDFKLVQSVINFNLINYNLLKNQNGYKWSQLTHRRLGS